MAHTGVVFLSGDVHFAELTCCRVAACQTVDYTLYDFTSSGLTHMVYFCVCTRRTVVTCACHSFLSTERGILGFDSRYGYDRHAQVLRPLY